MTGKLRPCLLIHIFLLAVESDEIFVNDLTPL